jgi:hypothetical protein
MDQVDRGLVQRHLTLTHTQNLARLHERILLQTNALPGETVNKVSFGKQSKENKEKKKIQTCFRCN